MIEFPPLPNSTVFTNQVRDAEPVVTYVVPVFNQCQIIEETLSSLFSAATLYFDIIIVDDYSMDDSLPVIQHFLSNHPSKLLCSYTIIQNQSPVYETACDNQGFRVARTEFIIEVQADTKILEKGFDLKMITVADCPGVGTVSGRAVHPFALLDGKGAWIRYPLFRLKQRMDPYYNCVGLIGWKAKPINLDGSSFYLGETNCRGPWLVRKSDLRMLSFLDEKNYFLGNDDHDFNYRLFISCSRAAAYIPIEQVSRAQDGSSRKIRSGVNLAIYKYLSLNKTGSNAFNNFLHSYRPYLATVGVMQ
jgi:glycosyltransferase involved in cell wall biosynthesis